MRDDLQCKVFAAIFDPGATEGFKGARSLTEWQTAAVMKVLTTHAGDWRPIETAPKDGSVILLGLPVVGNLVASDRRTYEGRWDQEQGKFTSANGFIVLDTARWWRPLPAVPEGA